MFCQTSKHIPTVDDIMDMVGVANPEILPDGKWILYTRSNLDWKTNKRNSNLWIVSTDTKDTFQYQWRARIATRMVTRWKVDCVYFGARKGKQRPRDLCYAH